MPDPSWTFASIGLALFCTLLFLAGLGERDLTSSHEARAAQNAQMILDEGHWLVPRLFDQHLELQKPPLYYWLVALIGWLSGGHVGVWAVRLPAALSGLACVVFLYLLGVKSQRPLAGFISALVLATCMHFTWLARVGRIDMPLTMTITFALGGFYLGNLDGNRKWAWHAFAYASLGVGLLFKGPIAFVLPAAVVGLTWLVRDVGLGALFQSPSPLYSRERGWGEGCIFRAGSPLTPGPSPPSTGERGARWRSTLWWGVPLMLAIAAPWFIWANDRTDNQLFEVFFWYHNVERGLGGSEILKAHPWWFYLAQAPLDLLPWSLAVPTAGYVFFRKKEMRTDDAACLGLLWFGAVALFLSCMSFKRADYLLPAYPGMAIFLGAVAETWWRRQSAAPARAAQVVFASVLAVCVGGWFVYSTWLLGDEERAWPYRKIAAEIRRQTTGPVVFFRAESHLLAYHVGQPVTTVLEWENLDRWAHRPRTIYIVMPEACASEWRDHLGAGALEEVLRTSDYATGKRDRPLVVFRTQTHLSRARSVLAE